MNTNTTTFECPRCASEIHLEKAAVRTTSFVCPVCLEGEIARVSARASAGVARPRHTPRRARQARPVPVA